MGGGLQEARDPHHRLRNRDSNRTPKWPAAGGGQPTGILTGRRPLMRVDARLRQDRAPTSNPDCPDGARSPAADEGVALRAAARPSHPVADGTSDCGGRQLSVRATRRISRTHSKDRGPGNSSVPVQAHGGGCRRSREIAQMQQAISLVAQDGLSSDCSPLPAGGRSSIAESRISARSSCDAGCC